MIKIVDDIILVGTSHVAKQSKKEIIAAIEFYKPELVCLELDIDRFNHLMNPRKDKKTPNYKILREIGFAGYLFAKIGGFTQKKIGKSLGIEPGIDMKTGYLEARKNKIATALIDIHISKTLRKLSQISFSKKIKLVFNLFTKGFKKEYREKLYFNPKDGVPEEEQILLMIEMIRKEVPILYKILIGDRNMYMANKIMELKKNHKGAVMAIMGAGHLKGIENILTNKIFANQISFSFNIDVEQNE